MIKVALIDDHIVLRKGLSVLISLFSEFEIVLEANNGQDFIDQLETLEQLPDVVLLDITMPEMNGVETSQWIKKNHPEIKVLVLSIIMNEFIVARMLKNGVSGFLQKDCEPSQLREALLQVHQKGNFYNEYLTPRMKSRQEHDDTPAAQLTEQELNFIRWVCTEKTYREIAEEMNISHRTVDGYRDALFRKLNVTSRVGIALYAIRSQIVKV